MSEISTIPERWPSFRSLVLLFHPQPPAKEDFLQPGMLAFVCHGTVRQPKIPKGNHESLFFHIFFIHYTLTPDSFLLLVPGRIITLCNTPLVTMKGERHPRWHTHTSSIPPTSGAAGHQGCPRLPPIHSPIFLFFVFMYSGRQCPYV